MKVLIHGEVSEWAEIHGVRQEYVMSPDLSSICYERVFNEIFDMEGVQKKRGSNMNNTICKRGRVNGRP